MYCFCFFDRNMNVSLLLIIGCFNCPTELCDYIINVLLNYNIHVLFTKNTKHFPWLSSNTFSTLICLTVRAAAHSHRNLSLTCMWYTEYAESQLEHLTQNKIGIKLVLRTIIVFVLIVSPCYTEYTCNKSWMWLGFFVQPYTSIQHSLL